MENIRSISTVSKKEQVITLAGPTSEIELTDKELEAIRGGWDHYGRGYDDDERRRRRHYDCNDWKRW